MPSSTMTSLHATSPKSHWFLKFWMATKGRPTMKRPSASARLKMYTVVADAILSSFKMDTTTREFPAKPTTQMTR